MERLILRQLQERGAGPVEVLMSSRVVVASILVLATAAFAAADSDLWIVIEGPELNRSDADVTYTVRYGNRGPDDASPVVVEVELPEQVPDAVYRLDDDELLAIQASTGGQDTLGNLVRAERNPACDRVRLRLVAVDVIGPDPPVSVAAGEEGSFSFTVRLPSYAPGSYAVEVLEPARLATTIWRVGRGVCGVCGPQPNDCDYQSPRLDGPPLVMADDGSASPSLACGPLVGDLSGAVAVVRDGVCDLETKNHQAAAAGALAVLLVNDGICDRPPSGPSCVDDLVDLDPGTGPTPIPMVMVSEADGEPLAAALEEGETVTASLGTRYSGELWFTARIGIDAAGVTDPVPDDNLVAFLSHPGRADLWSAVEGPTAPRFGDEATYTVRYGNLGPDTAVSAYVNLELPPGVPARFDEITGAQRDAIAASMEGTDSRGNQPLLFSANSCESLLVQLQGPGPDGPHPLQALAPGEQGQFQVTLTFPMAPTLAGGLRVDAPAELAGEITELGRGSCDDCNDLLGTCFGEPLSLFDLGSVAAVVARDQGSTDPAMACNPLVNDVAGKVALIRRGDCEFSDKVFNAEADGAVGVVIVNNGTCNGVIDPGCVIPMTPAFSPLTTIPAVMVSQLDGEPLIAAADAGRTVELTLGGIPTRAPAFASTAFLTDTMEEEDPAPANDDGVLAVWLNTIVPDGPVRNGAVGVR